MRLRNMAAAVAAMGLATAPVAAAPSAASKLSLGNGARTSAAEGDERLGSGGGAVIALILVAGIIAIPLVGELLGNDDDDSPASP